MKIPRSKLAAPALLLALALAGVAGCGGQSQKGSLSPAQASESAPSSADDDRDHESANSDSLFTDDATDGDSRKAKIAVLFREIGDRRVDLSLSREPGGDAIESVRGTSMAQTEQAKPKSASCKQICRISGKICENAGLICELAEDLGDDPWALEKCESAKASCEEASKRCASCVTAE